MRYFFKFFVTLNLFLFFIKLDVYASTTYYTNEIYKNSNDNDESGYKDVFTYTGVLYGVTDAINLANDNNVNFVLYDSNNNVVSVPYARTWYPGGSTSSDVTSSITHYIKNDNRTVITWDTNIILFNNLFAYQKYISGAVMSPDDFYYIPSDKYLDNDGKIMDKPETQAFNKNIPNMTGTSVVQSDKNDATPDFIIKWTDKNTTYHVDIMITYSYKTGIFSSVKYKNIIIKDYYNNILDSNGTYKLLREDMVAIAKKDNSDESDRFGPYGFTKVYLRYSDVNSGKYLYGNWRYITIYGGTQGVIDVDSGDTTTDADGNIIESKPDSSFDGDGNAQNDDSSFSSFLEGLSKSPKIISSIFNGISSLVTGIGKVPVALSSLLVGCPNEIWTLLKIGIGCMVAIGIFKMIK